jgi:hypothetical protein
MPLVTWKHGPMVCPRYSIKSTSTLLVRMLREKYCNSWMAATCWANGTTQWSSSSQKFRIRTNWRICVRSVYAMLYIKWHQRYCLTGWNWFSLRLYQKTKVLLFPIDWSQITYW